MKVNPPTAITGPATLPPPVLVDHDGTDVHAPCVSRIPCPPTKPELPPVLVDHDGTPWPPPKPGHGRA